MFSSFDSTAAAADREKRKETSWVYGFQLPSQGSASISQAFIESKRLLLLATIAPGERVRQVEKKERKKSRARHKLLSLLSEHDEMML